DQVFRHRGTSWVVWLQMAIRSRLPARPVEGGLCPLRIAMIRPERVGGGGDGLGEEADALRRVARGDERFAEERGGAVAVGRRAGDDEVAVLAEKVSGLDGGAEWFDRLARAPSIEAHPAESERRQGSRSTRGRKVSP